jgi:hypothetical protein
MNVFFQLCEFLSLSYLWQGTWHAWIHVLSQVLDPASFISAAGILTQSLSLKAQASTIYHGWQLLWGSTQVWWGRSYFGGRDDIIYIYIIWIYIYIHKCIYYSISVKSFEHVKFVKGSLHWRKLTIAHPWNVPIASGAPFSLRDSSSTKWHSRKEPTDCRRYSSSHAGCCLLSCLVIQCVKAVSAQMWKIMKICNGYPLVN